MMASLTGADQIPAHHTPKARAPDNTPQPSQRPPLPYFKMTNQLSDHEDHFMRIAHARPFTDLQLNIAQILARGLEGLPENDGSRDWMENVVGICLEAIAEAVQPEPEGVGVTDFKEELMAAWDKAILLPRTGRLAEYRAWLAHVLALVWAVGRRPTTKPVPVSERLPGREDCAPWPGEPDATHWAWAGKCVDGGWEWSQLSMLGLGSNTLGRIIAGGGWTHWLPHHALPVPGAEVG
jgi:hypothetical protein